MHIWHLDIEYHAAIIVPIEFFDRFEAVNAGNASSAKVSGVPTTRTGKRLAKVLLTEISPPSALTIVCVIANHRSVSIFSELRILFMILVRFFAVKIFSVPIVHYHQKGKSVE